MITQRPRVLVVGNCIADRVYVTDQPLPYGEKSVVQSVQQYAGGQAANVAYTLQMLGAEIVFCGVFGNDQGARLCRQSLEEINVDLSYSQHRDVANQSAVVIVDGKANRTILTYRDAGLNFDITQLESLQIEQFSALYLDGHELAAGGQLASRAQSAGIPIYSDMEFVSQEGLTLLSSIDHLIAPEGVLLEIYSANTIQECLLHLQTRFGIRSIVATQGERGCVGLYGHEQQSLKAIPLSAIDTTGAGDAFHAAYVYQSLFNKPFEQCLGSSTKLAAEKCRHAGPRIPRESFLEVLL